MHLYIMHKKQTQPQLVPVDTVFAGLTILGLGTTLASITVWCEFSLDGQLFCSILARYTLQQYDYRVLVT